MQIWRYIKRRAMAEIKYSQYKYQVNIDVHISINICISLFR